ncbi:Subtilase family protein [Geodermatophilus africanus]|uniref:Subtilase family protein n=1 Tax=Geodermatophilus africanus TaxID=1137993 RepID=A0A1H3RFU5_9ACTN|nr:S8 family peptidase [Geodermatophilus africanus]SDZ24614.1 Subtilase family protein [Geodermatophilus africanus]
MARHLDPALDPRLRRLVLAQDDPARLEDLAEQEIPVRDGGIPAEGAPRTRVLVRTSGEAPTAGTPTSSWTTVAEGIYAVEIPVAELEALAEDPRVQFVEAARLMAPELVTSVPTTRADLLRVAAPPRPALTGKGTVVGIIDFGLDFTLGDFIDPHGNTRVAFLWDQSLTPQAGESSPAGFGRGVEYDAAAINVALKDPNPFSVVRHLPDVASHGTHVAGTAVGSGRSGDANFPAGQHVGVAPEATIVFVQPDTTGNAGSFTDSVAVAEAISYVYAKARELGLPCVINMSLGQNGGSHDGESLVEQAVDRLLEVPGRAFVHAAGNEHIWRGHASGVLATGDVRTLQWRTGGGIPLPGMTLPPGSDRTPNELEIWYSPRDELHVRLTDPTGAVTAVVVPGQTQSHSFPGGNRAFIDSERFSSLNGDARIFIAVDRGTAPRVAAGIWQVEITAARARSGRFDAWIERDARDRANNFADQSFFVGTDFDPVMTLGTPATSRRGISVANYDHVTVAPSASSSRGRTRDGRDKPEVAAPGTNIVSSCALGGRPDGAGGVHPMRTAKSGTSMAAPHVAGIIALLLQMDPTLTAAQLRKAVLASADPPNGVLPFDAAWGYGRVDAVEAARLLT